MKTIRFKIKPVGALSQSRWHSLSSCLKNSLYGLILALCGVVMITSCKTTYLPSNSSTEVNIKDSTVLNIKDSVRITERSRYKDYGKLLDTLKVDGQRSHSKSWIDTTYNILNSELVEDPVEEKTKVIYRDRWKTRDSLVYVEKPVPVEVIKEKKIYPKWMIVLSLLGVVSTLILGFIGYLKIKKKLI